MIVIIEFIIIYKNTKKRFNLNKNIKKIHHMIKFEMNYVKH